MLEDTRSTWARCYNGEPATKADRQISLLRADRELPVADHECQQCGREFVPRHPGERFCDDDCRLGHRRANEPLKIAA